MRLPAILGIILLTVRLGLAQPGAADWLNSHDFGASGSAFETTAKTLQVLASDAAMANGGEPNSLRKHYVFARYLVNCNAYGERVEDFKREIREAQAAGIDGFDLRCGAGVVCYRFLTASVTEDRTPRDGG